MLTRESFWLLSGGHCPFKGFCAVSRRMYLYTCVCMLSIQGLWEHRGDYFCLADAISEVGSCHNIVLTMFQFFLSVMML